MKKRTNISDAEKRVFREAMKKVKPIAKPNKHDQPTKKTYKPAQDEPEEISIPLTDHDIEPVTADEQLLFTASGVQTKTIRQLRQGHFEPEAVLDLHGDTIEQARTALLQFIMASQQQGLRHLLVVHGKGYRAKSDHPILKNKVNTWLRQIPQVLAFCSAKPKDGGTGAVYIILKRSLRVPL